MTTGRKHLPILQIVTIYISASDSPNRFATPTSFIRTCHLLRYLLYRSQQERRGIIDCYGERAARLRYGPYSRTNLQWRICQLVEVGLAFVYILVLFGELPDKPVGPVYSEGTIRILPLENLYRTLWDYHCYWQSISCTRKTKDVIALAPSLHVTKA